MKQIILMSIRPEWVVKILNGEKTIEVRKVPIKDGTKVYAYCTKAKPELCYPFAKAKSISMEDGWEKRLRDEYLMNGKVVCEFIVDKCEKIENKSIGFMPHTSDFWTATMNQQELLKSSCLTRDEMAIYIFSNFKSIGYAWHISQLKVYDKPKELGEFKHSWIMKVPCESDDDDYDKKMFTKLTHAPQSYCYVEELPNED